MMVIQNMLRDKSGKNELKNCPIRLKQVPVKLPVNFFELICSVGLAVLDEDGKLKTNTQESGVNIG